MIRRLLPWRAAAAVLVLGWPAQPALACEGGVDGARIAVAGGSLTETLYLLGAEDRIVGVDSTSTHPEAASRFPSIGYVRALSAEGVLSLSPTLLLGEDDMGPPEVLDQLARAGVAVVRVPEERSAAGIVAKVRCVADVLSLAPTAESIIEAELEPVRAALAGIGAGAGPKPRAALVLGVRNGAPISAGAGTSGNGVLEMAGAENLFAGFEGWKPVSLEAMLQADPQYIVVSERGMAADPGGLSGEPLLDFAMLADRDRVVRMDAMALLGFGPRTLFAALELARRIQPRIDAAPKAHE